MTPPLASKLHDPARLAALDDFDVLDTAPEPGFDDVVALARDVCGTSAALVSLVAADRQWFKARSGFERCETPIGQSVCAYALASHDLLVIPDLTADARTKDNTLVTGEPHLRFYAGAPLATATGEIVGTVCVLDGEPRPGGLTRRQATALQALAREVVALLEMRRALSRRDEALVRERRSGDANLVRALASEQEGRRSQDTVARVMAAQEAGRVGTFAVDLATEQLHGSAELCRIYGLPGLPSYPVARFEACIVEEDRGLASTRASRKDGSAFSSVEFRIRRASDGAVRWVARRGDFIRDTAGQPIRFTGTVLDVTERKFVELRQVALLDLGDTLRDATSTAEIKATASRLLGATLDASRVGYAVVDQPAETLAVECDWTAPDVPSIAGTYPLATFARTIRRLGDGTALGEADITATNWLGDEADAYLAMGTRALIEVPLLQEGLLVGLLFVHSPTPRAWSAEELDFTRAMADRTHAALAKVMAEDEQRVLHQELSHRLKNTLAMVQAIATQTLRGVTERGAVDTFKQRLAALGRAHDVLLERSWASARIRAVVDGALAPHADPSRLAVGGPDLSLGPKAVLSITLLLHELATNAIKYGSLSAEGGRVTVGWMVDRADLSPSLVLTWTERGGPAAVESSRRGFGSRLIAMGLSGTGGATLRYNHAGFEAEFSAPLSLVSDT